ncbi:MAG TPA: GNAT family N-acetyltransferase [Nanoarchaeota archaeon]|nr:GNAT family N-acetyltransferase [Nanoarchaeota archaeon]
MKIETKRLILREWNKKDAGDLVEGLNNLEVTKWLTFAPYPYTKKDAKEWINYCIKLSKKGSKRESYEFAIELKSGKKVIGGVSLNKINRFQGTAGGGIWLNKNYQDKGYGSEAFGVRLNFAFNQLKLRRIENGFLKGNKSSFKMLKRLGYKLEGMKREAFRCKADGKLKDEYIMGLLRKEWKKN